MKIKYKNQPSDNTSTTSLLAEVMYSINKMINSDKFLPFAVRYISDDFIELLKTEFYSSPNL